MVSLVVVNLELIPAQYNPYRIFADGNDKTPDTIPPFQH